MQPDTGAAMSEGEVVPELVEFTNILLAGVSLIFSIVSAYVVALNYFIGSIQFLARFASFAFMTLILGMLMMVMIGAQDTQIGLIERLREIEAQPNSPPRAAPCLPTPRQNGSAS